MIRVCNKDNLTATNSIILHFLILLLPLGPFFFVSKESLSSCPLNTQFPRDSLLPLKSIPRASHSHARLQSPPLCHMFWCKCLGSSQSPVLAVHHQDGGAFESNSFMRVELTWMELVLKKVPESCLAPSTMWGHHKKSAICNLEEPSATQNPPCWHPDLHPSSLWTGRNKCLLLFTSYCFNLVTEVQTDTHIFC